MYHSTSVENAKSILENGFTSSKTNDNMLGQGIYVSADIEKALDYGPVTFKLLVYPGWVRAVTRQGDEWQKTWQRKYSSAWVPPNCGMVYSGRQENCVKSKRQIKILGVVRGYDDLDYDVQSMCEDLYWK